MQTTPDRCVFWEIPCWLAALGEQAGARRQASLSCRVRERTTRKPLQGPTRVGLGTLGWVLTTHSAAGRSVARAHHSPSPSLRNCWDAQHSCSRQARFTPLPSPPPLNPPLPNTLLCMHLELSQCPLPLPLHSRHLPIVLLHSAAAAAPLPFQPSRFGPSLILDRHRHLAEPHMLPALFGAIHMTIHPFHSFRLTFDLLSTSLLITCPPNNSLNSLHSLVPP